MIFELWQRGGAFDLRLWPYFDENKVGEVEFHPAEVNDDSASPQLVTATLIALSGDPAVGKTVTISSMNPAVATVSGVSLTSDSNGRVSFNVTRIGSGSTFARMVVDGRGWLCPVVYSDAAWRPPAVTQAEGKEPTPLAPHDHVLLGRSRVITQYRDAARFNQMMASILARSNEVESTLWDVTNQVDIDVAEGAQLDTLGEIVGAYRQVPEAIPIAFFGFAGYAGAQTFGEEGDLSIGGRFRDESEPSTAATFLADPEYRVLIKGRISRNTSHGSPDEIIAAVAFLLGVTTYPAPFPIIIGDGGGMAFSLAIGRQMSSVEKAMIKHLDLIPRPAGVMISEIATFDPANYFGFAGQAGAAGFREEAATTGGGVFSEEI